MKTPIDMLIALKKPWLDHVSELIGNSSQLPWRPSGKDLAKFWDLAADAHLRHEREAVKPLLDAWLQSYFVSEIDTGKLATDIQPILIPILSSCEHALRQAAAESFNEVEQLRLYDAIIPLFNQLYDLAATLELGMYVHELRRREEAVLDKVQRLDETRSSFINTAAHELKTPLTLIEGYTEMLVEALDSGERSADYEILMRGIRTGTTKMRAIIDELIDVSLVDNQMLSLYYQPVRVGVLLDQIAKSLEIPIAEKSLSFDIKPFSGSDQTTYADEERLIQAFTHVLRNAVQYTPEGGSIELDGRLLPGFIEITCSDTGIGIAREDQATIFDEFGRMPDSPARRDAGDRGRNTGPGLGLHLARGILEAHGGAIWVESPVRDDESCPGSTFHMMLPVRETPPESPAISQFERKD